MSVRWQIWNIEGAWSYCRGLSYREALEMVRGMDDDFVVIPA